MTTLPGGPTYADASCTFQGFTASVMAVALFVDLPRVVRGWCRHVTYSLPTSGTRTCGTFRRVNRTFPPAPCARNRSSSRTCMSRYRISPSGTRPSVNTSKKNSSATSSSCVTSARYTHASASSRLLVPALAGISTPSCRPVSGMSTTTAAPPRRISGVRTTPLDRIASSQSSRPSVALSSSTLARLYVCTSTVSAIESTRRIPYLPSSGNGTWNV